MSESVPDDVRARFRVEGDWWCWLPYTVRWRDCDLFGHVNHAAYFAWFEDVRSVCLERDGLPRLTPDTPGPVIAQLDMRYVKALGYRDEVLLTGRTVEVRRTSFAMEYAVWRAGLVAQSRQVMVMMVNATGAKVPIPDALRRIWINRDRAVDAR